jgi:uncharacterized membrane protein YeaQ/YmgE (transglycosylase-associated protein family)
LAGWLSGILVGKSDRKGCVGNVVVGVIGAFIGGLVMRIFGFDGITGFNLWSILVATLGAVILLFILNVIRR